MAADVAALTRPIGDEAAAVLAQPSPLASFWAAFRENRGAVIGLAVFAIIVLLALTANVVAPHSPIEQFRDAVRAPPVWEKGGSWRFVLGTDGDGHDMLSRLIFGARVSLFIGLSVMCVSFIVGVALGLVAAMAGPVFDVAITRLMDLIMAVPSLVLAVLVVAVLGPSLANTIIAVTIVYLPNFVRLARASALGELNKDYVTAARVVGVGPLRLAASTVLPNCLAPLIVQAALGVSSAILEAAALGFLGLGAQPPTPGMGLDAGQLARIHPLRSLDRRPSRLGHSHHRHRHQSDRRRPARRARSEDAERVMAPPLLEIRNLSVSFATRHGPFTAVDGFDLTLERNEVLAIVGESGSGKSVAMLAAMGLLPPTATVSADRMAFDGADLLSMSASERRRIAGKDMAMIFQEPMSSLNPCFTVGFQIGETLKTHLDLKRAERDRRIVELLAEVGIPDPERRARAYPHQLSGGMSQRVMIAMALACRPKLLIADEPTTALDVTIQAQILDLLMRERRDNGMGLVLITHDMGVVAETADRVIVQYAGQQMEMNAHARSCSPIPTIPIPQRFWRRCRSGRTDGACPPFRASCRGRSTARAAACSRRAAPMFSTPAMMPSRRRLSPRLAARAV